MRYTTFRTIELTGYRAKYINYTLNYFYISMSNISSIWGVQFLICLLVIVFALYATGESAYGLEFISAIMSTSTGVLAVTFDADVNPDSVDTAKFHIREQDSATGGITLTGSAVTTNGTQVLLALTDAHRIALKELYHPRLTIDKAAVTDSTGDLFDTTFDISTALFLNSVSVQVADTGSDGIEFNNDGTRMFIGDYANPVREYALSAAFDMSTARFLRNSDELSDSTGYFAFNLNGSRLFVSLNDGLIGQYDMPAPFDISDLTFAGSLDVSENDSFLYDIFFDADGHNLFVTGGDGEQIYQYLLSAPFELSGTASHVASFEFQEGIPVSAVFGNDGIRMVVLNDKDEIFQYIAPAAFNLTGVRYDDTSIDLLNPENGGITSSHGLAFNNDGTKMFVVDNPDHFTVVEYILGTFEMEPTPSISTAESSPVNSSRITFTVDFGEPIDASTFAASDISASAGTVSGPLQADATARFFTFEIADIPVGNLTVSIPEGVVLDPAGNGNAASQPYEIERTRPVPSISTAESSPVNSSRITFTVDFGEPIDAGTFAASDISASAGTVSGPLQADATARFFMFEITDIPVGNLIVSIPEVVVLDPAGSGNAASQPYVIEIERTRPVPSISTAESSPVNSFRITFTVDFGEPIDAGTFAASDISASAGTVSGPLQADATARFFTFEVVDIIGILTVSIPEGRILDLAGNGNTASKSLTVTITGIPDGTTPDAAFVTTWQTTSANEEIMIPTGGAGGSYTVTWGDGSIYTDVSGDQIHVYKEPGIYTVSIRGDFTRIYLPYYPEVLPKLLSIEQWGDIRWESMRNAFTFATNMVYRATDAPDLSSVTDMSEMFRFALRFNGNLSNWDVSSVTDMSGMFAVARAFNGDVSTWNVSSATDMSGMFQATANNFDQNLGNWYVVLHDTSISGANETLAISAQNRYLDSQNPTYTVDDPRFVITGGALAIKPGLSVPPGSYEVTVTSTGSFGQGNSKKVEISVDAAQANSPPSVDAGEQVAVSEGVQVTLNGTASDPEGDHLTYLWSHDSALPITISDATSPLTTFTAPTVDSDATVTFVLSVSDGTNTDVTDQVTITIQDVPTNNPPTVDAGQDRTVNEGDAVILSGTASDPEADHLTYLWSHDSALPITISDATSPLTTFTAPTVDSDATVTFVLSVSDGTNTDVTDQVTITIQDVPTNNPPTVDAGQDRTVNEGDTLTLNGTAFDADGDALTYLWSHDSDLEIALDSPLSTSVSFTVPQVTSNATVTFTMTVTDKHNATGSDAVVIAILDVPADDLPDTVDNLPQKNTVVWNAPEQHGPRDISRITLSSAAPETIHATWDVPGEAPANYRVSWAKTGESYLPLTNSAGNTFPSVPSQTITGLEEGGEYRVKVLAGYGDTAGDWSGDVIITVARSTVNQLTVRAVPDQTVSEMSVLEFTVTVDGDGHPADTLVYGLDGAPAGALIDPTTGEFEWTPAENQDGHHTIVITASDSGNRTATSHVNVAVGEVNMDPVLDKIPDLAADDLSVVTFILNATDDDRHPGVGAETVVGNLRIPWSIDWTPDGTALFTERDGNLRVIYDGVLESEPLLSIDVGDVEGGLLGLAVDPDFEENQYIYLYYTYTENSVPINKVVRYQFSNGTVTEDMVLLDGIPGAQYHDGGRIQFGPDEKLYITTGDAGNPSLAQDSDSLAGKILRINRDGTVPAGNPFANSTVWSIGHRNPQGIDWDEYGNLVASEHGPSGGIRGSAHDEINLIVPGANYGWPDIIGGDSAEGLQTPILHSGRETWAPSGAEFYDGDKIAGWTGKYFVAALRGAHLHMIDIDPQTHTVLSHEKLFQDEFGRLRDVQTGPDGFLYVLTSNRDGRGTPESIDDRILRIVPVFEPGSERPANSLTYGLDGASKGASVNQITGVFTWETPNVQEDSVFTFNVTVSDGAGGAAVQTVTIRVDDTHAELPRDPRDIGVVTLNSTVPGIVDISWDAPSQTPANYRVSWAKAGEPYLARTDPAGNAFPTVPFHTITGLEEGGEYRIKVRASYSGTSGDWSDEVTATVAESPVVPNTHATGLPVITGTVQVGYTLTADISGIADADGITGVSFNYRWISDNGTAETEIGGGGGEVTAASRHVLTADDLGDTIKVRVEFTDDAGHAESLTSAATHAVAPAYAVPGVPANLLVSQGDSGGILKVSWQAPASNGGSNLTGYTVQWKATSDSWAIPADIAEVTLTGTTHTITGLTDGTPYAVRVLATNVIGDGKPTSEETATPQAPVPLRDPRDIGVVTLNSTVPGIVTVSWDAPGQTPANYRVSWAKAGEPYLTWTDPAGNAFPTVPFHTITGLEEGGEYRIKVRASYSGTSGDWSDEVTATVAESPVVPNTPATGMPVITGTVQVGYTLTADISGIADADGITGVSFNYRWISDNGTAETEIGGGGGDGVAASRHVLTTDDLGDTIKVRVAFTDDAGHAESLTSAATHAVAPAYAVPGVPANLLVSQGDSGGILKVSWQAPASNGGSNLTGYTVQWKVTSDSWTIPADIAEATVTGTAHTITGLTDGTPYAVRVLATNVIGDGKPTSEETATPQAPVPLRDPRDIGVVTLNSTVPGIVDVSWDAPGQTPANYRVSWAKAGEPYLTWTDPAGNAFPTVPFHTITGLEEGGEYRIKVRASYSGTSGDWSDEVTATVAKTFHPFITTWQTTVAGESITIPVGGATGIYTIDWGDGNVNYGVSGDQIHTYDDAGTYTVRISGDFARIYLNGQQPNADKLQSIEQWGSVRWESMRSAFQGTSSMAYRATDTPDLSDVISMRYMFRNAASFFNADLSAWDVSSVTDMRGMFYNAASFNDDLSAWGVSSVTDTRGMFMGAASFNADLSAWDVSSVTDMSHMFRNAASFNADLSAWDVSSVTAMSDMFRNTASFNANLSAWNVSRVTDMDAMFDDTRVFDQNLGMWYIVLDDTVIEGGNSTGTIGTITAQNSFLDGQNPIYGIEPGGDSDHFEIDGTALKLRATAQNSLAGGSYTITITSTGEFGTGNSRTYEIVVADA